MRFLTDTMADVEKDLIKAETLLAQYEYDKARKKFNDVIKAEPKNPMGYFGKAEASLGMPKVKVDDIIELYQKAIELDPENVYFLTTLGSFCSDVGKFNEAEQLYTKATEIDEENASLYFPEFAISYFLKAPIIMEKFLDDNTRKMIKKKALVYMLRALNMDEAEAKELLSD